VHPNRFHKVLEHLPVEAWQLIQHEAGLTIRLVGPCSTELCAIAERAVRATLADAGADIPPISARCVETLVRGITGKAPLIASQLSARKRSDSNCDNRDVWRAPR
jgi:hypothetical protein